MDTKHTQEKWQIAGDNQDFVYAIGPNGGNKFWVSVSSAGSDRISDEEKAANARLIAAAPDLLAVLTKIRDYHVNHHVLHEIDAAITKATGEASQDDEASA